MGRLYVGVVADKGLLSSPRTTHALLTPASGDPLPHATHDFESQTEVLRFGTFMTNVIAIYHTNSETSYPDRSSCFQADGGSPLTHDRTDELLETAFASACFAKETGSCTYARASTRAGCDAASFEKAA